MKTYLFLIIAFFLMTGFVTAQDKKASASLTAAIYEEEVTGNLDKAVELYLDILKKYPDDRPVAAKALYHLGLVNEKMGKQKAIDYFTRLVNTYPDQTEMVTLAKARLKALGSPSGPAPVTAMAEGPVTRRILADASDIEGSLTSDGKYIMYMDQRTGDVVQFEVASGQKSLIKNKEPFDQNDPIVEDHLFSRDGQQIAYSTIGYFDSTNLVFNLQIRNLDGSGLRILYSGVVDYIQVLDWSPDAKFIIAAISRTNGTELTLISTVDGSERILKSFTTGWFTLQGASFSPDIQFVAFSLELEGNPLQSGIFVITTDGRIETAIAGHPADDRLIAWTPDGQNLIFLSDRSGTKDIWTVRITRGKQEGEPELLKKNFGIDSEVLGFTPDASLYYKTYTHSGGLYNGEVDIETGEVIVAAKMAKTRYTSPPDQLKWSTNGNNLLYIPRLGNNFRENNILIIQSTLNGEERILSPPLRFVNQISWAPNDRSVIALGSTETGTGIYKIDTETSGITKIAGDNHYAPHLCPDGKTLVFIKRGPIISKESLDTGEVTEVVKVAPTRTGYDLSPDGREVVFQMDHAIKILSLSGGEPRELFREAPKNTSDWWEYELRWTRDGRYIIARSTTQQVDQNHLFMSGSEIWRIPVQGGTPLKLDLSVPNMVSFALHPDNRHFAFSVNEGTKSELYVIENFLPKEKKEENNQLTMRKLDYAQLSYPYAEISPDGKKIAYYIAGQTKQGIGILDLESGATKVLVESGAGGQASKVWSPQSNKIAYRLHDKEIQICDIDGANTQLFYKSPEYKLYPTDWSKDGKKILCFFEAEDRTMRIGTIAADGQVRVLASGNQAEFVSEPKFSPDGRYIACSLKDEKGNSDIFILTSDVSQKERVASYPGRDECPVWSPDGKYLLFISDRNRSADLWGIQVNNGKAVGAPFIIKRDLGWQTMIQDLTANGKLFLFMMGGNEPGNMFTIPVDQVSGNLKGPIAPISVYPTDHSFPRYSPDGKMIAFLSRRGQVGYPKLFVIDEKGVEREIALQSHYAVNIAWHPDNKSLFFAGWDKTLIPGIYEVLLETGEIKPVYQNDNFDFKMNKGMLVNINLLPDAGEMMFFKFQGNDNVEVNTLRPGALQPEAVLPVVKMPIWGMPSPDGNNICYRLGDSLMVISVSDGTAKHIGASTLNLEATWSPDGENLMFREGSSLRIFSPEDSSTRTLYQASGGKTIGGMEMYANTWSPDGSHIIITERDTSVSATSQQKVIIINTGDGSVSTLGEAPAGYRLSELRWSPDGSRVLATGKSTGSTGAPGYEYWVLENFLPK